jgi:hypothetical protein
MDNGPESGGRRTQFLYRMVELADMINKPIQLLYYPPYHSKYNPIERCWGILELKWNGTKLTDAETMLEWAKQMTWKGLHPVVELSREVYEKGISLGKAAMQAVEARLKRDPKLPKYDILINPASTARKGKFFSGNRLSFTSEDSYHASLPRYCNRDTKTHQQFLKAYKTHKYNRLFDL